MAATIKSRLRRLGTRFGFGADWYIFLLAGLIGVGMSIVAIAFVLPLRWLEDRAQDVAAAGISWHWILVLTVPALGALVAGTIIHLIPSIARGPGVSTVIFAIHRRKSKLPPILAFRKWLAATFTIGSGGSAGAEGPIVTIGATLGSWAAERFRMNPQNKATILGCAAAAGIASVFNAPIAGIFFVLEILLRDFSLRTFSPIVVASVISAGCTNEFLGGGALFKLGADFSEDAFHVGEIPNYLILGVLCGAAAVLFIRTLHLSEAIFAKLKVHPLLRPAIGALFLGALGLGYLALRPDTVPAFYGNGYPMIEELTSRGYYNVDGEVDGEFNTAGIVLITLIAIGVFKALATSLTIGSGAAGGMFAPSLLMGASVGGAMGWIVNRLDWASSATAPHYAVVGMAAMVAATTHAPLTAMLIVFETTHSFEILLPVMFTAVIATVIGRVIYRESVYTASLTKQGVRLGGLSDLTILRRLSAADVPLEPPVTVSPHDSAQHLLDLMEQHAVADFVVVDEHSHYVGLVTGADLRAALIYREAIPLLQVNELQRSDLPTVALDETLDLVLDKFSRYDVQSLAVLDDSGSGRVRGLITRSRLMRQYQIALGRDSRGYGIQA